MRKLIAIAAAFFATSAFAFTVTATLVSERVGTSVSGMPIRVCVYQYNGQQYEKVVPMSVGCPFTVQLQ